jgi:hypothetical protein
MRVFSNVKWPTRGVLETCSRKNPKAPLPALEWFLLAVFGAALAFQLLAPPIVGLADNGDFSRVASSLGIFPPEDLGDRAFFEWIVPRYRFDADRIWIHGLCCYSSQTALALIALPVGLATAPPGRFDLRATGLVNGLALVGAVALLLFALRPLSLFRRGIAGLLLVVAFSDVGYVSFLNSFYTEPAALVFFLAALALALLLARTPNPPAWLAGAFFLASALLTTSRPQNAPLGFFLAVLGWRITGYDDAPRRRFVLLAAGLLGVVSFAYSRSTSSLLERMYHFNAVFRVLLPDSPEPHRDLAALGLPAHFARWIDVPGFSPQAPVNDAAFLRAFDHVGYGRLALFYAERPARLWKQLDRAAAEAFEMRPDGVGNFAEETGAPPFAVSGSFSAWSRAKARFLPGRVGFLALYFLGSLAAAIHLRGKATRTATRRIAEIWLALVFIAAFQFAVASVVTGATSRRSFFFFNAVFDVTLIVLLVRISDLRRDRAPATERS